MSERFGTLRALLQQAPSEQVWRELCEELGLWGEEEREQVALPYAAEHLARWPAQIKRWALLSRHPAWAARLGNCLGACEPELLRSLLEDEAWVEGCRHISFEVLGFYEEVYEQLERFGQLVSLSISGYRLDGDMLVSLLSRAWPPSLRELTVDGLSHQPKGPRRQSVEALVGNGSLAGLEVLSLRQAALSVQRVEALAQSPYLRQLRTLELRGCGMDAACARVLAQSPVLETVTRLDVSSNPLGEGLAALLDSPYTRGLSTLKMSLQLDAAGARALGEVEWPPGLDGFELDEVRCDRHTFDALAGAPILRLVKQFKWHGKQADQPTGLMASPHLIGLRELELINADEAVMAALRNPALGGLESLTIKTQRLSARCIAALTVSALADNLRSLELNASRPGVGALCEAGSWGALRSLTLKGLTRADGFTGCRTTPSITDEDVERLAASGVLGRLEVLDLNANLLSDMAAMALADSGMLGGLRALSLRENRIGLAGIRALLRSPDIGALEELDLEDNPLTDEDIAALAADPALANVRGTLKLGCEDAREQTWQALIDSPHASQGTREHATRRAEVLRQQAQRGQG